jgi:hypothetical protein
MTRYTEARLTRPIVEWMPDTRIPAEVPNDSDREPTNAPIFLAVMAVMLIGLSLIASVA